jgi:hypothetical protein
MSILDQLYHSFYSRLKLRYRRKSTSFLALFYVTIVQFLLLVITALFCYGFSRQMHFQLISDSVNVYVLSVLTALVIYFKNWLYYSGKKRSILKAKYNKTKNTHYSFFTLFFIPFGLCAIVVGFVIILT